MHRSISAVSIRGSISNVSVHGSLSTINVQGSISTVSVHGSIALSVYMVVLVLSVYMVVLVLSVYTTGISNCRKELKFTYVIGATFSFSKGIIFIAYAVLFYLGAWLITTKTPNNPQPITFEDMMMYVVLHSLSLPNYALECAGIRFVL